MTRRRSKEPSLEDLPVGFVGKVRSLSMGKTGELIVVVSSPFQIPGYRDVIHGMDVFSSIWIDGEGRVKILRGIGRGSWLNHYFFNLVERL